MLPKINGIMRINSKELRYLPSGQAVIKLNCVSSEKYKTQGGEQKENSCWIECVSFGKQAEAINTYFNEKDRIFISGSLKQENWTAQDNTKRSKHVVTIDSFDFIEKKDSGQNQHGYNNQPRNGSNEQSSYQQQNQPQYSSQRPDNVPTIDVDEDSIPFAPIGLQYPMLIHAI